MRLRKKTEKKEYDIVIIGGGITGVALAYGLIKKQSALKIAVLDSVTETNKASRTNVGLIWCQSKFVHEPHFAQWGFESSKLFPSLVKDLEDISGINIPLSHQGGLIPTLGEGEFKKRGDYIEELKKVLNHYPGEMIDRAGLEKKLPKINFGNEVTGAAWCEEDGFIEPLFLMRAYRESLRKLGVAFFEDTMVYDVEKEQSAYKVKSSRGYYHCERLVLAAGLANKRLAKFALEQTPLPIFADKGQVLLTERMPFVMPIPLLGCTQTFGGTVIIGFRHETRGHDNTVVSESVSQEGAWAIRMWPDLGKKRIIRTWPGLRVMPNDNVAIYSHLPHNPKVTLVNTHSAVTMAAAHSEHIPAYILGNDLPDCAKKMTLERFGITL